MGEKAVANGLTYQQALAKAQEQSRRTRKPLWVMEKDGSYAAVPMSKWGKAQADGWVKVEGVRVA